ncbi:jg5472 [Pararge aegeria aegeria]|uniref:Jg5472 protein n=1 Tax=Pararge aegeria aegeria TaxID=348720 RepID=A0A8S4SPB6_9NEOP|nr:jg5472 [Pararge aegeria aegeria]
MQDFCGAISFGNVETSTVFPSETGSRTSETVLLEVYSFAVDVLSGRVATPMPCRIDSSQCACCSIPLSAQSCAYVACFERQFHFLRYSFTQALFALAYRAITSPGGALEM